MVNPNKQYQRHVILDASNISKHKKIRDGLALIRKRNVLSSKTRYGLALIKNVTDNFHFTFSEKREPKISMALHWNKKKTKGKCTSNG